MGVHDQSREFDDIQGEWSYANRRPQRIQLVGRELPKSILYLKSLFAKGVRSTLDHSEKIKFFLFLPYCNIVMQNKFAMIYYPTIWM